MKNLRVGTKVDTGSGRFLTYQGERNWRASHDDKWDAEGKCGKGVIVGWRRFDTCHDPQIVVKLDSGGFIAAPEIFLREKVVDD